MSERLTNPYSALPADAFWSSAVSRLHQSDLRGLWSTPALGPEVEVASAGSCFAQHLSRAMRARGLNFLDAEPRPPFVGEAGAERFGYGVYSARYGNVYSSRQMLQLAQEALGLRAPEGVAWRGPGGRFYDALRPSVTPGGLSSEDLVLSSRARHLARVAEVLSRCDVFALTLGLTEVWEGPDGTAYPSAPGVEAGEFDPDLHRLRMMTYAATASGRHVLVANAQSKSTLRAAAWDLCESSEGAALYFPSYEIVCGHQSRGSLFEPGLRRVNRAGVELVMRHFFNDDGVAGPRDPDVVCSEDLLE